MEKELTKLLEISLERGRGESSTMKDLDDNVVMALTRASISASASGSRGMVVRVMETEVLVHWNLMGHQWLNPAVDKSAHQSCAGEALLLQCINCFQKVLHLALESGLHSIMPLLRRR